MRRIPSASLYWGRGIETAEPAKQVGTEKRTMTLICLIGRHGSGKSTLGRLLSLRGFEHISVGVLFRLAKKGRYPSDIPVRIMIRLGRLPPGTPMPENIARDLLSYAATKRHCLIDGFPATTAHLSLLPPGVRVVLMWSPKALRMARLEHRSANSVRKWTNGRTSARDNELADLLRHCRKTTGPGSVIFVANRGEGERTLDDTADRLAGLVASQTLPAENNNDNNEPGRLPATPIISPPVTRPP